MRYFCAKKCICNMYVVMEVYMNQANILYFSNDGIVISISIWQCLLEFCTNCLINGCLFVFKEHSYDLLVFLLLVTYCLNYMILPSFYLLADSRFRNSFYQKGSFRAIWSALKQNYESHISWIKIIYIFISWGCETNQYFCYINQQSLNKHKNTSPVYFRLIHILIRDF